MQKEFNNGFLAQLEERFEEADSNMTINLSESDTKYKALKVRLAELEREFPFIETVLDGNGVTMPWRWLQAPGHSPLPACALRDIGPPLP